jgi:hypothetical protein
MKIDVTPAQLKQIISALAFVSCDDLVLDIDEKTEGKYLNTVLKLLEDNDIKEISDVSLYFETREDILKYCKANNRKNLKQLLPYCKLTSEK